MTVSAFVVCTLNPARRSFPSMMSPFRFSDGVHTVSKNGSAAAPAAVSTRETSSGGKLSSFRCSLLSDLGLDLKTTTGEAFLGSSAFSAEHARKKQTTAAPRTRYLPAVANIKSFILSHVWFP